MQKKWFVLPLISMVTGIGGLAAGIYSAIEIQAIKRTQAKLRDHVKNLKTRVEVDHQKMVELEKIQKIIRVHLLAIFILRDKLNSIECDLQDSIKTLANYIVISRL